MTPTFLAGLTLWVVGLSVFGLLWSHLPTLWGAPWVPSLPGPRCQPVSCKIRNQV